LLLREVVSMLVYDSVMGDMMIMVNDSLMHHYRRRHFWTQEKFLCVRSRQ